MRNQIKYKVLTLSHGEIYHLYVRLSLANSDALACCVSLDITKRVKY